MDCSSSGSSVHEILLANTGVGCHSLLQGVFLTQGSNLGLLYCRLFCNAWMNKWFKGAPSWVTSLVAQSVKHLSTMWETRVRSLVREGPWRRKWQSTLVLLPGKSHGQRSLVRYSPWGCKESDTTERIHRSPGWVLRFPLDPARNQCVCLHLCVWPVDWTSALHVFFSTSFSSSKLPSSESSWPFQVHTYAWDICQYLNTL